MRLNNADQPASPTVHTNAHLNGLTKREQFAMAAMQGILSDSEINYSKVEFMAIEAVTCADELLKALEATK